MIAAIIERFHIFQRIFLFFFYFDSTLVSYIISSKFARQKYDIFHDFQAFTFTHFDFSALWAESYGSVDVILLSLGFPHSFCGIFATNSRITFCCESMEDLSQTHGNIAYWKYYAQIETETYLPLPKGIKLRIVMDLKSQYGAQHKISYVFPIWKNLVLWYSHVYICSPMVENKWMHVQHYSRTKIW